MTNHQRYTQSPNTGGYRYLFNGQEGDNEVFGETALHAFEYRMHDARLGRFWSVDPLAAKYPWNSTYAFAENSPIGYLEMEGLEKIQFGKVSINFSNLNKNQVRATLNTNTMTTIMAISRSKKSCKRTMTMNIGKCQTSLTST